VDIVDHGSIRPLIWTTSLTYTRGCWVMAASGGGCNITCQHLVCPALAPVGENEVFTVASAVTVVTPVPVAGTFLNRTT